MTPNQAQFSGGNNQGLQVGHNPGSINYYSPSAPHPRPPPSAIIPYRRDRDFIERNVLNDIWQRAFEPGARIALVGLGGVGKSQVAIEYAYRVREKHAQTWVFWVHASSAARFIESYKKIAQRVQLTGWQEPKADILGLVHSWLSDEHNGQWTLVLDNADDKDVMFRPLNDDVNPERSAFGSTAHSLAGYLPSSGIGSIIITTRNRQIAEKLIEYPEDILYLKPMDADLSVALLTKKLDNDRAGASREGLLRLAQQLDYMPLAMSQAAAFVNQRAPRVTVSMYFEQIERSDEDRANLLRVSLCDPRRDGEVSNSIIITWHVTFEHLLQECHSAVRLLSLMSLFDREGIPDRLLRGGYLEDAAKEKEKKNNEEATKRIDVDFENDIDTLRAYDLIMMGENPGLFEMHRLVQFSTRTWLEMHQKLAIWQEKYIDILGTAFPTFNVSNETTCEALIPHVKAMEMYLVVSAEHRLVWAKVLYEAVSYYTYSFLPRGELHTERMARSSLQVRRDLLGLDDAATLASLDILGIVLEEKGKISEAAEVKRQELEQQEKVLGLDHPATTASRADLHLLLLWQSEPVFQIGEI